MSENQGHPIVDLSGVWRACLDDGIDEKTFALPEELEFDAAVRLPGTLDAQGFGSEITIETQWTGEIRDNEWLVSPRYKPYREPGRIKIPYWLQPDKRYVGPAWYRRTFTIPADWEQKLVTLRLERPHWRTQVWIDETRVGSDDSLSVPHIYELGRLEAGEHRITVCVDNRMIHNIGQNSHSVADHTQGNWNGIVGAIELFASDPVRIHSVVVTPSTGHKSAMVRTEVENLLGVRAYAVVTLNASGALSGKPISSSEIIIEPGISAIHVEYRLGESAQCWDEFHPAVGMLEVGLSATANSGRRFADRKVTSIALREVATRGTQITINGRSIFLRGSLECCVFPRTGHPPTDTDSWRKLYRQAKAHGLNHIRFHSWCPPEAAFAVADEMGIYLQVECSTWANQGASVGTDPDFDAWLFREGERIIAEYGNHPSFILMAYGNEPAGRTEEFLGLWVEYWKRRDRRRIYTSAAGWPMIPENDYHDTPIPRIQAWGQGLESRINALPPETCTNYSDIIEKHPIPIVSHEIGQWCAFPNFDEINKYIGSLHPRNFEIFRDFLRENGMEDQASDFLLASGKLQTACYKEEIESSLRTPGFGGFQLLGLSDFPGQGTALVGILDAFWESKGYVSPAQFNEFCSETVPLLRMQKRYWRRSETFTAGVDVAHFGPADIDQATLSWQLRKYNQRPPASTYEDEDTQYVQVAGGSLTADLRTGSLNSVGALELKLSGFEPGRRYSFVLTVESAQHRTYTNRWDLWLFDDAFDVDPGRTVHYSSALDQESRRVLEGGGVVFLELPPGRVATDARLGFSSVFWNTAWTEGQAPHTLGLVCDPRHPAFDAFPTRAYSDWLWWDPLHGAAAMVVDHFPSDARPIIQPIDTWFRSHRLAVLVEARVGSGRIMISSMDLSTSLPDRPAARQLRQSIVRYMETKEFRPLLQLAFKDIETLYRE